MKSLKPTRRLEPGDRSPLIEVETIRSEQITVPSPEGMTHLQFRRYAGCPICNIHLRSITRRHEEIVGAGIREVVVFHSSSEDMLPHQGELPFAVIADPDKKLYVTFGVEKSRWALLHPQAWSRPMDPRAWVTVARGLRAGGRPYPTKRESLIGLPADFLIDIEGQVRAVKYGRHFSDQWSVDELLRLATSTRD
ncbi:peroxiredoxin-like family protein [Actinomadura sp. 6N118]|uniref:peroxiredoxin-like family protein n=1 Tax=Actinomadura sp. 6N118 TaxID=3375151 RepID=UPI0037B1AA7F